MGYLEAIILGIVQGLTEFLPVSSSGHLELGKVLLGDNSLPKESMLFTVVVHFATALSTLVVFRRQVLGICVGLFARESQGSWSFTGKIILSMVPAALVGVFLADELESLFDRQILLVGGMLLVFVAFIALLLVVGLFMTPLIRDRLRKRNESSRSEEEG